MKRKTRKLRKMLLMISCMLTLVAVTVGATLAYLTDTDEVVNTFTVGNVDIDLNETDVDGKNGTKENDYHLVPGGTYVKDPTVTIKANSEPSYVRMFVTVEDYADLFTNTRNHKSEIDKPTVSIDGWGRLNPEAFMNISDAWILTNVPQISSSPIYSCTYEYRYEKTTEKKGQDDDLPALFTQFTIPGCFTNDDLLALREGYTWHAGSVQNQGAESYLYPFKINVRAEAIQAAGFADADAASSATAIPGSWACGRCPPPKVPC